MSQNEKPAFQVVSGNPTAEELAVVVAVLQAAAAESNSKAEAAGKLRKTTSTWSRNQAMLRSPLVIGPGQWRGSVRDGLK